MSLVRKSVAAGLLLFLPTLARAGPVPIQSGGGDPESFTARAPLPDGEATWWDGNSLYRLAGSEVEGPPWLLQLRLTLAGRNGAWYSVPDPLTTVSTHEIEHQRGLITERHSAFSDRIESEYRLAWNPWGDPSEPAYLQFSFGASAGGSVDPDRVRIIDELREVRLVLTELSVVDGNGDQVEADFDAPSSPYLRIRLENTEGPQPFTARFVARTTSLDLSSPIRGGDFGRRVSAAGDVDGDGLADLLIGARRTDDPEADAGSVFLHSGSLDGVVLAPTTSFTGSAAGARLGDGIAHAGDVDADGYSDVLLGESGTGRVSLHRGSSSGLLASASWTWAPGPDAGAGAALAGLGDIDGDGYDDIAVGEPLHHGPAGLFAGRVLFFRGGPSGLEVSPSAVLDGTAAHAHFGEVVAEAGDVDGDGFPDVIVSAPLHDSAAFDDAGLVQVFRGGPGLPAHPALAEREGEGAGHRLGSSLAALGDWDGDGVLEIAVGSPWASFPGVLEVGVVRVLDGASLAVDLVLQGNAAGERFGFAIAGGASDVDGDGFTDLAVAAPWADEAAGQVRFYCGSAEPSREPCRVTRGAVGEELGIALDALGDVNGDGFGDVAAGAWFHEGQLGPTQGRVRIVRGEGRMPGDSPTAVIEPEEGLGTNVGWVGDVNADGYDDALFGSEEALDGAGVVELYLGGPRGLERSAWRFEGADPDDGVGGGVLVSPGDVDGDGHDDVLVGLPFRDGPGGWGAGRLLVFGGTPDGLTVEPRWMIDGTVYYEGVGRRVQPAGDVNGDGLADFVVASAQTGLVRLYAGSPDGPALAWEYQAVFVRFAFNLDYAAGVGDVDGDGFSDVAVAEFDAVRLFRGSPTGLSASPGYEAAGRFEAVRGLGDVTGDGIADFVAFNPSATPGRHAVELFLGGAAGPTRRSSSLAQGVGELVAAGDWNGDGRGDVVADGQSIDLYLGTVEGLSTDPVWSVFDRPRVSVGGDADADGRPELIRSRSTFGPDVKIFQGGSQGRGSAVRHVTATGPLARMGLVESGFGFDATLPTLGFASEVRLEWQLRAPAEPWPAGFQATDWGAPGQTVTADSTLPGFAAHLRWRFAGRDGWRFRTPWRQRPAAAEEADLRRINLPPTASIVAEPAWARISFRSAASDPEGEALRHAWRLLDCPDGALVSDPTGTVAEVELVDGACGADCGIELEARDPHGQADTAIATAWLGAVSVDAGDDRSLGCADWSAQLVATVPLFGPEGITVRWTPGIALDDASSLTPLAGSPGSYTVEITDLASGCVASDTVAVLPGVLAIEPGGRHELTCLVRAITLTATLEGAMGTLTYEWTPDEPLATPNAPSTEVAVPGAYRVVVTDDATGCVASTVFEVVDLTTKEPSALDREPTAAPLRVERTPAGELELSWQSVSDDSLYSAFRGTMSSLIGGAHDHSAFGACQVGVNRLSTPLPAEDSYFLVASDCGGAFEAGSLGRSSLGAERPVALVDCP